MGWIVYDKTGEIGRCTIKELEYNGSFMGERTISCSFESPVVINFAIGDYLTYRGEVFYLYYTPSQTKSASSGSAQDAFEYDLVFNTVDVELQNCQLLDYVPYGNDYHYQPSPSFSFVGTAKTFAERIQANMNRDYPGWTIDVYEGVETEEAEIQIDNTSCWNALVMINKEFGLNFLVTKRRVRIGYPEDSLNHTFYYGKDNGLYQITRNVNADEAIVTRLYAYGGERNIPSDYNKRESDFSGKKNLMLPGYLETGKSYIESKNISAYGVREYTQLFEDIYPSIAGVELPGIGRIDELVSAEQITEETETSGSFKVTIKNIGFNIKDYLTSETATISMRSGSLIGYEFDIVEVIQLENGDYEVTLNKSTRDNFQVPNAGQNLSTGDRFILLNINMPDKYVEYAEDKLLNAATSYLADHDHVTYTYDIGVDEIYMARNGNLHDLIREGMRLPLYDADFGTDYSIIIQSLSIKEGEDIPVYEISLSDKPIASTIDKIWDAIDNVRNEGSVSKGGYVIGGGLSPEELNKKYLRKDVNDTAHGEIIFDKKIGSSIFLDGMDGKGWEIKADGRAIFDESWFRGNVLFKKRVGSHTFISGFPNGFGWDIAPYKRVNSAGVEEQKFRLEIDDINVRGSLRVYEFIVSQLRGENDNVIFSGMMKVEYYDHATGRIYLDTGNGVLYNPFRSGDILMVQHFGGMPTGENDYNIIKQYELRVDQVGIGNLSDGEDRLDWITFVNFAGDKADIAQGDVLTRIDSVADSTRKGIVKITTIDEIGAPYMDVVYGMKTDPDNATKARIGNLSGIRTKNGIDLTGVWGIYGNGAYFENSTYILDTGNTVEQEFSIMNGKFESSIEGIRNDISLEPGNILKNSSFSQNTDYWVTENSISFWGHDGSFIYANDSFLSEKRGVSDIYQDGNRNVLRISDSYILQRNDVINIPSHETEATEYDYSFSLHYRVVKAGILTAGFEGSSLYVSMSLEPSSSYRKLSKAGKWDERGDFRISFDGEILIYGVSLFIDNLADAIIRLETRIEQTEESIKLAATKDYVDEETGKVYTKYDSQLNITAGQISAISTRVDNIRNEIDTAGWINTTQGNTLFAAKSLENGDNIISYINQTATTTTIKSNRINLVGAVTYSDLDSSLQDKVDAAGGDALDKALEAYEKASDAYSIANSADSTASSAYSRATTAITDATNALNAAKEANTSVELLPGWVKENDIIKALEDKTIIVNGYIATSMIDVNNLYAKKLAATEGTIGAFKIMSYKSLETDDADAFIRMHEAGQVFTFIYAGHVESHSGKGAALIGIADNSDSMALYTEGDITFKGLSTTAESSYWKPLLIHTNTGEIRRSS
ncbi:hypothetical protein [Parabacteroides distasonis]|jgi:hypothetical protein|uniref:hypothetical protein n=1 Tax=Parabacteroides distasonis TaxID=823 RepID=UPI001BA7F09C|nr:hypothetical protein [Parabacteroides distasonis]DAJ57580.1 MAG TPA: tail protein [Caudoviricetes sp.]